ncbi:MAG: PRTRC system protein C [Chloroflexota bacterium]
MPRFFVYEGREMPDPDPSLTVEEVRDAMSAYFPELANAETSEHKDGDKTYITFQKRVGTKGCASHGC